MYCEKHPFSWIKYETDEDGPITRSYCPVCVAENKDSDEADDE